MAGPLVIKAMVEVLPVTTNLLRGKAVGEVEVLAMAALLVIKEVAKVFLAIVELLAIEVV